ncbi:glycerophosphodiester phosphodiesterase [Chitinophaga agrisoli]|uniref:Glycerophosphodiester phosphodiesterase n=2 Tax=Chitinophaga agrisoli TaxID=2607653 RepID=A0A5B2VZH2_9BACT|nr:glycerophosphodiester phosphodiesterase [Chitinophaga agrisoli]
MQGNKLLVSSNLGSATLTLLQADSFSVDDYGGQIVFLRAKGTAVTGIKINVPAASLQDAIGTKAVVATEPAVAAVAPAGPREPFVKKGQVDLEAHQGGCGLCPCNTITAFINAVKLGVNTLEMDAVISKDNQVLISHDQFMDFTMRTPQGKDDITKENQLQYNIYTMPYDSVRKYDAGSRANPYFPKQRKQKTYKPLLAEVIDSVESYVKAHGLQPVKYNIEVKSLRGDNVYHPAPGPFTDLVVKVINDKDIVNRVVIQSFDIRALQYLHAHYPAFRTSYLVGVKNTGSVQDNINRLGFVPDVYSPEFPMVTAATVEQVHGLGMNLIPWTIDKKEDIANIVGLGVDGVITNYPDVAKKLIKEKK